MGFRARAARRKDPHPALADARAAFSRSTGEGSAARAGARANHLLPERAAAAMLSLPNGWEAPLAEIRNREELEAWLRKQPREVAVAFAARAALRVLPVLQRAHGQAGGAVFFGDIVLPVFRAAGVTWVAVKYPTQVTGLAAAADSAEAARAAAAASADTVDARRASTVAFAAVLAVHATVLAAVVAASNAATSADNAALAASDPAFWSAVSGDATRIEEEKDSASIIACSPLWPNGQPEELASLWKDMKAALRAEKQDWDVWTDWYEDRLDGRVRDEQRELAYVLIEDALRNQGPAIVNAEIKRRIEQQISHANLRATEDPDIAEITVVVEPKPRRRRKKEQKPSPAPEIPPQRPAALEPVWANGILVLPPMPARTDGDKRANAAALKALRAEHVELADDVDAERSNFDKRATAYIRRIAERIPGRPPPQHELFRLAHAKEVLEAYGATVNDQWPDHLAARYHALTLHFDRTIRQFPKWREFVRNAKEDRLTPELAAKVPALAKEFGELLRDQEAQEFIGPQISTSLEVLLAPLHSGTARLEVQNLDPIEAGKLLLAEDVVESISNIAKRLSESALGVYTSDLGQGIGEEFRKSGKPDGKKVAAWLKKAVVTLSAAGLLYLFPQLAWIIPLKFIFGRRSNDKNP